MKKIRVLIMLIFFIFTLVLFSSIHFANNSTDIEYKAQVWIDTDKDENCKYECIIRGWLMTDDEESTMKFYINGEEKETIIQREERQDVLSAIKGYGGDEKNPQPGFIAKINTNDYKDGAYNLKIIIISRNGHVLAQNERTIIIDSKIKAKVYIDEPAQNNIKTELNIKGWVMSEDEEAKLRVFIDNKEKETVIQRTERKDVIRNIKGYGVGEKNPTPGFEALIDVSNYTDGNHELIIKVVSREGEVLEEKRKCFEIRKYNSKLYIDTAENENCKYECKIKGWLMTEDEESTIKFYINGEEKEAIIQREERQDVLNAIKGYGGVEKNPLPGYLATINTDGYSDGTYKLTVKNISRNNEVLAEKGIQIRIDSDLKAKMYIDEPAQNNIKTELKIKGWVMTEDEQSVIKVYIDGTEKNTSYQRKGREDVIKVVKGYGGVEKNPTPGFETLIDTSHYSDGSHELIIKIVSREGKELEEKRKNLEIKKYNTKMYIDTIENENCKYECKIKGWVMTEDEESTMKFYINGEEKEATIKREERQDVINAIKGYGGVKKNPLPGYIATINTDGYSDGTYKLTVKNISRNNEVLAEKGIQIRIDSDLKAKMYIDEPAQNNIKTELKIKGWVMAEDEQSTIKVFIDGIEKYATHQRFEREDVIKAIKGYGGIEKNPTPGFESSVIDTSGYRDGDYELKIQVISREGKVIGESKKNIHIKKYDGKVTIDGPLINREDARLQMNLHGWVMSEDELSKIKIYIDGVEKDNLDIEREEREDVLRVIQDFGGREKNPMPGYRTTIDTSEYKDGIHTVKVEALSRDNEFIASSEVQFRIKKYNTTICIDSPKDTNFRTDSGLANVYIRGWVMSELGNKEIWISVDNRRWNFNQEYRQDVLNDVRGFGDANSNPIPGFNLMLYDVGQGQHKVTIQVKSNVLDEIIESKEFYFTVEKTGPVLISEATLTSPGSGYYRNINLSIASSTVNGTVLGPGEVFDWGARVGQATLAKGYQYAAVFQGNTVTQGVGGGICQVSSTLYQAARDAGMWIIERHNHSMQPTYTTLGNDAAVSYGVLNFVFQNPYPYSIYIEMSSDGGSVNCKIYRI